MNLLTPFLGQLKRHAEQYGAHKSARQLAVLESKHAYVAPSFDDLLRLAHESLHHTAAEYANWHQRHLPKHSGLVPPNELIQWLSKEVESFAPLAEKHLLSRCAVIATDVFNLQSTTPDALTFRVSQIASLIACHAEVVRIGYRHKHSRKGFAKLISVLRKEENNWGWDKAVIPDLQMFLSERKRRSRSSSLN